MKEDFLHYLWQYQYFKKTKLLSTKQKIIEIIDIGYKNSNAGPDFLNAIVKIEGIVWAGHIEIHLKPDLWYSHKHHQDPNYNTVILHVVWEGNEDVESKNKYSIPTLELQKYTNSKLLNTYYTFSSNPNPIFCSPYLDKLPLSLLQNTLKQNLFKRLNVKSKHILRCLEKRQNNWEYTYLETIVAQFGLPLNKTPFEHLARILDYKVLAKHRDNPFQIEAFLFGIAGFLDFELNIETAPDQYAYKLKKEYNFLKQKYQLKTPLTKAQWTFNRLRPANFPTTRLAQLVSFFVQTDKLFEATFKNQSLKIVKSFFSLKQNAYWQTHYHFGKVSKKPLGGLGKLSQNTLIINALIPTLIARAHFEKNQDYIKKALDLLHILPWEDNQITRLWKSKSQPLVSSYDSQAFYALYRQACEKKACLKCAIGRSLLKI